MELYLPVPNDKAYGYQILHVALSSGPSPRGVNYNPRVKLIAKGYKFYIGLYIEILLLKIRTMATNFSPCKGSYVLNQFPSNVMFGMNGFHVSASGAIQGHHGPLVLAHLSTMCSRELLGWWCVRCPSSTISLNMFSSQTAGPVWTKLGRSVPWEVFFKNCSQNLIPSKTLVCHGNETEFFKQFFKNLLLWNRWSDFRIISKESSLGDPFQKLSAKFWSVHKHGSGEWGLLAL